MRKSFISILFILILALLVLPAAVGAQINTYTSTPGLGIADAADLSCTNPGSISDTITVPDAIGVGDLDVALNINHTFVADLTITLASPSGTTVTLLGSNICSHNGSGNDVVTTLDDESPNGSVDVPNPPTQPSYQPSSPLSAFDGENAQGDWTLTIYDYASQDTGTLNSWSLIIDTTPTGTPKPASEDRDVDGDGIPNYRDNCPHEANPDQEDGWGTAMGDVCDTDWYNMRGIGINAFEQKDGMFHVHGNCIFLADGDPRCPVIASFDPTSLTPEAMPMELTTAEAGTWSVWIYYLHSNHGADVYQVNIYSTNPPQPDTLIDDRLEIHVIGGTWRWYQRGGDQDYGGLSPDGGSSGVSEKAG